MKTTRSACTRHCCNGCGLLVTEHDDGSVKITGDPAHPVTRGFLCAKTSRILDRLRAEDRIVEPMIRKNGVLEKASWNEALDLVAGRMNALRKTPERMLNVFYVASYGLLFRASPALFGRLGASEVSGDYCMEAGVDAHHLDFGGTFQPAWDDLQYARRLVNWGSNMDAQAHLAGREILRRRKEGLKVLSISPGDAGYRRFSDDVITIRPGTDRFLALAVIKLLMDRGADLAMARDRAFNWMEFEALAGMQDLEQLLAVCNVSREDALLVADYYLNGPTATMEGRGTQRYTYGGENIRFLNALALCSGWLGVPGGGVYFTQSDRGHIRYDWFKRPEPAPRSLPVHDLGRALEEADPSVEFVFIEGTNVVNQAPAAPRLKRALERPFVVAVEAFMNDTALVADVILPPALMLETEDITRCSAHGYVHHSARVFEPRGQARSAFDISREIAARLDPPLPFPEAEEVMTEALRAARMTTDLDTLRAEGYVPAPEVERPFENGVFHHPDGLARLPGVLHAEPMAPEAYPLRLLSFVNRQHLLSQIPEAEQAGLQKLWLAPENPLLEANGGNLDPSGECFLETEHGVMPVAVGLRPGLDDHSAYILRGGWLKTGWGLNGLIGAHVGDLGGQCAYYAQWCVVRN